MFHLANAPRIAALALAVALGGSLIGASSADAYTRSSSTTGPAGGKWSSSGAGGCYGGACASNQSATGRRGNTVTRSGATSCSGGSCYGGATFTGPAGNTATRSRSFSR
jgi:hypothetical protein